MRFNSKTIYYLNAMRIKVKEGKKGKRPSKKTPKKIIFEGTFPLSFRSLKYNNH